MYENKEKHKKISNSVFVVSRTIVGPPQAQAGEFRRAMYFLCSLALMGTEDQLLQAKSKGEVWSRLGWRGRLELRVSSRPLQLRVSFVLVTCTWMENLCVSPCDCSSRHMVTSNLNNLFHSQLDSTYCYASRFRLKKRWTTVYVPPPMQTLSSPFELAMFELIFVLHRFLEQRLLSEAESKHC